MKASVFFMICGALAIPVSTFLLALGYGTGNISDMIFGGAGFVTAIWMITDSYKYILDHIREKRGEEFTKGFDAGIEWCKVRDKIENDEI